MTSLCMLLALRGWKWWCDEAGQDLAEYAVLLGIVAVLVIGAIVVMGDELSRIFHLAVTTMAGLPPGG